MSHVETFKTSIIRIRDLLRSQAITGMDSMRHICLYLMSRYMTREKALALGIPNEFAWETLMELTQTVNGGLQYALDRFYHKEGDCLVNHFDRLFGTDKFPFDVKSLARHKETLEILDKVNIASVDLHMDVLGWVYEQHLKTGSTAARDLGQYFTDRSICTYMTELCRPGFKYPGVPESMCDPSMGTGGFQAAYMKYYKRHHPDAPVDWAVQQKEIHGCDTDQKVAGVARLNLFMEAGGARFDHLLHQDSLYGDLPQTGYDVILANMPFGLDGLKHAECCERVKALKIRGTKSEPLFLQLIMVSLNAGGRCAVVVPDGMLVNPSACHNGTRKYLMDHFELKRVIKMSGKFFMNTTIKPSILFFENTGKPTATVEFWDVVSDGKGVMTETMVLSVPRASLDATCSLDMRRYQEAKEVANPAGFPIVKLSEACNISKGKRCLVSVESGGYPYQDVAHVSRMVEKYLVDTPVVLTPRAMSIGRFVYSEEKCHPSDDMFILTPKDNLNAKYVYYYCVLHLATTFKESLHGVKPTIDYSVFDYTHIIVPPLAIQAEIVATLDRIYAPGTTELADTLKMTDRAMDLVLAQPSGATLEPIVEAQRLIRKSAQMVADIKAQMAAIVKSVGSRGFSEKRLSEACDISKGKRCLEAVSDSGYPYYDVAKISRMVAKYILDTPAILTPRVMSIGRFVYVDDKCHPSDDMFILKPTVGLHPKYLYYYCSLLLSAHFKESLHGVKPTIDYSVFDYTNITIPPLDFQTAVLTRLETLQSQLTALESLQRQSEDNARFILESYLYTEQAPSAELQASSSEASDDEKEEPLARSTPIRRPRSVSPIRDASGHAITAVAATSAVAIPDYASMSLAALKDLCKERGLRGLSGKKKEDLVVILRDLS